MMLSILVLASVSLVRVTLVVSSKFDDRLGAVFFMNEFVDFLNPLLEN